MKTKINKKEKSQVEIEVTIPWADFYKYWDKGFKKIQDMVEIDGFRKGMAPKDMIISKYGEMTVLEAMSDLAINETYPAIVMENKLKIISHPHIHVVKLAKDNDFLYHAHVDIMPELTLPDYKAIAKEMTKEKTETTVTDQDVEKVLNDLRKMRVKKPADQEIKDEDLPALDDTFAQSFGEEFSTLETLKTKVRENTLLEKIQIEKEKLRSALLEKLANETKGDMPETLINGEIDRLYAQTKADIEKFGGTLCHTLPMCANKRQRLQTEGFSR